MENRARFSLALILVLAIAPTARAQDTTTTQQTTTQPPPAEGEVTTATTTETTEATPEGTVTTTETTAATEPAATTEAPPATTTTTTTVETTETVSEPDDFRNAWVLLGARVGVYIPGLVNRMDPHVLVGIEAGVLLPFAERRLAIVADVHYAPPGAGAQLTDPRIGDSGGPWTYHMTTEQLFTSLGLVFRLFPPGSMLVPYVGASGRLYFLRTTVDGDGAGQPFGTNTEQSMQGGFGVWLGGELRLGPGAAFVEAEFGWSDLPHRITGATSTSALAITLGYRFIL